MYTLQIAATPAMGSNGQMVYNMQVETFSTRTALLDYIKRVFGNPGDKSSRVSYIVRMTRTYTIYPKSNKK